MKYLCLIYQDETEIEAMPEAEYNAIVREVLDYREELAASGHYITSSPLQPGSTATTVRVRDGKSMITDGPFAETKEQLAGFYLIEARDMNEAIQVAAKIPPASLGSVEVRPVRDLPQR